VNEAQWKTLIQRFDPWVPASGTVRADRPYNRVFPYIRRVLRVPEGVARILVLGSIGSGKSTELLHVVETCPDDQRWVLFDVFQWFSRSGAPQALDAVKPWELLAIVAAHGWQAAEQLGYVDGLQAELRAINSAVAALDPSPGGVSPTVFDLASLASSAIVLIPGIGNVGLFFREMAKAVKLTWTPGRPDRPNPTISDPRVQELLAATNAVFRALRTVSSPPVLVVDGLDQIKDPNQAERIFYSGDILQGISDAHVIATAPLLVDLLPSGLWNRRTLAEVPVVDREDWRRLGDGVSFFHELWKARTVGLPADILSGEDLDRLAYYSGGVTRVFVRLVREVALAAYSSSGTVPRAVIDEVLDEYRREDVEGRHLHKGHVDALRQVLEDPDHRLPDGAHARDLVRLGKLLPYPNDTAWWFPHPLFLRGVLKPAGGAPR
jgi:hypothetical protein